VGIGYNRGVFPGLSAALLAPLLTPFPARAEDGPAVRAQDLYHEVLTRARTRAEKGLAGTLRFEADHSRWEDPWVVKTPHFEVRATRSYLQTAEMARQLEFLRGEFVKVLGEGRSDGGPLRVWIFPSLGAYNTFGQEHGQLHSSILGSFYASQHPERPVVTFQSGNETLLGMWITHSVVHQYLQETFGPQNLLWVDEGLASYFALYWDWSYGASQLERIKSGRGFIRLERLLADPLEAYASKPEDRFIELGMFFHFLLNSCEETKNGATGDPATGPFQEFLRAAVRGQDVSDSEFLSTMEDALELLEEDFRNFDFAR